MELLPQFGDGNEGGHGGAEEDHGADDAEVDGAGALPAQAEDAADARLLVAVHALRIENGRRRPLKKYNIFLR